MFNFTIIIIDADAQMLTGNAPILTAGPWALFYAGSSILPKLSKEPPFPGFAILVLLSCLLWIFVFLTKTAYKVRFTKGKINSIDRCEIAWTGFSCFLPLCFEGEAHVLPEGAAERAGGERVQHPWLASFPPRCRLKK